MSKLRVAVIGGGHLGRIHAKLLSSRDDVQFVGVVDPSPASRDAAQQLNVPVFDDYKSLSEDMDAVIIASPTTYHFEIAAWCLKQRIHTLVEKPMVLAVNQAQRLCELADTNHCTLQVGHVERFNPAWTATAPHLENPKFIEANRVGMYSGRSTDIGIVLDLMVHDLDLILQLVESPISQVHASGLSVLGKHEDFAEARIEFEDGCVANLTASRLHRTPTRKMSVFCNDAFAEIDFATATAEITRPAQEVLSRQWQADDLPDDQRLKVKDELYDRWFQLQPVATQSVNAIAEEHSDFLRAISTGNSPKVTGQHGLKTIEVASTIIAQIQRSASKSSTEIPGLLPLRKVG